MVLNHSDYNPLTLAYLGDAYFEVIAREYLISNGDKKPSRLNQMSKSIVTASAQASFAGRMMPLLNEIELGIFKSGRNAKSPHRTKSASAIEYRIATGVECLYGYYCLSGLHERAKEIFMLCIQEVQNGYAD